MKKFTPLLLSFLLGATCYGSALASPLDAAVLNALAPQTAASADAATVSSETGGAVAPKSDAVTKVAASIDDPCMQLQATIRKFLAEKGLCEGQTPDGRYVYVGVEALHVPQGHPDYVRAKVNAYLRARMMALSSHVRSQGVQVTTELISTLEADNSSDAREFKRELASGKSAVHALYEKAVALGGAKLDRLLSECGISGDEFRASSPDRQKKLLERSVTERTLERCAKTVAGVCVVQTFVADQSNGGSAVGVVMLHSPSTQNFADALRNARPMKMKGKGKPLDQVIPFEDPDKLSSLLGTRLLIDENGEPVLVAFGHWGVQTQGSEALKTVNRQSAARQAEAAADAEIASFLSISFAESLETQRGEALTDIITLTGNGELKEQMPRRLIDILKSRSSTKASSFLSGVYRLGQSTYKDGSGEAVCVVKALSLKSLFEAKGSPEPPVVSAERSPASGGAAAVSTVRAGGVYSDLNVF